MWPGKDHPARPPTPRWNPSIIVSPTSTLLHQRRSNPKAGRSYSPLRRAFSSENDLTTLHQQQQEDYHHQHTPSSTSSPVRGQTAPMKNSPQQTQQQQQNPATVDPRRVSFTVEPSIMTDTQHQHAIHSLPQVAQVQPNTRPGEMTPPNSLLSLSFSSALNAASWVPYASPLPVRSHTEPSGNSTPGSHTVEESDSQSASESGSASSSRVTRPNFPKTGGKVPRLTIRTQAAMRAQNIYGDKLPVPVRPSNLSYVESADSPSSFSGHTPVSGIPSIHGSSSGNSSSESAYPRSALSHSSGSVAVGSSSARRASFSSSMAASSGSGPRNDMDAQINSYINRNEHRVRQVMEDALPKLFETCEGLVRSMQDGVGLTTMSSGEREPDQVISGGWANMALGTTHDHVHPLAQDYQRPLAHPGWQPPNPKRDETYLQDPRYQDQDTPFPMPKSPFGKDALRSKGAHMESIKEEETLGADDSDSDVHGDRDRGSTPSPSKRSRQDNIDSVTQGLHPNTPVLQESTAAEGPHMDLGSSLGTLAYQSSDEEEGVVKREGHSPQRSNSSQTFSPADSVGLGHRKRKRGQERISKQPESAITNVTLQLGGAQEEEHSFVATGKSAGDTATTPERQVSFQIGAVQGGNFFDISGTSAGDTMTTPERRASPSAAFRVGETSVQDLKPSLRQDEASGDQSDELKNSSPGHVSNKGGPSVQALKQSSPLGRASKQEWPSSDSVDKKEESLDTSLSSTPPSSKVGGTDAMTNPRLPIVKWSNDLNHCIYAFLECCVQITLYLQQPSQTANLSHSEHAPESPQSRILTPLQHSARSTVPEPSAPVSMQNIQHAPLSVKMKLKVELSKLMKGANDIIGTIEKYHAERAELLDKIEKHRQNLCNCSCTGCAKGRAFGEVSNCHQHDDSALRELERCLDLMDMRQKSRVRFGSLELQASCAGLYQMLRSVFA
ncbi:hypothetical protein BGX29_008608 [Mortierella sp. GBA35]|nr:hypothetical protein BGX29_008608 [Mortierella sp. GBA35]